MKNFPEVAVRIAEARRQLRYEKRFYCPHDGRMVAAVVPFGGESYLGVVGRRDDHAQSLLAELREQLDATPAPGEDDMVRARLLDADRRVSDDGHAITPPSAYRLADDYYRLTAELGFEPVPQHAPCPRCHRSVALRVTPEGVTQDRAPDRK